MIEAFKSWGEMTDAEKLSLSLAKRNGKGIEYKHYFEDGSNGWIPTSFISPQDSVEYRIKPELVVETVILYGRPGLQWVLDKFPYDTHRITFATINGEPDCSSIKMEKL